MLPARLPTRLLAAVLLLLPLAARAARADSLPADVPPLAVVSVAGPAHAIVGPLNNRTPQNLGNNATFGLVVTDAGLVLIDSGGTALGARAILDAVRTVSDQPIVAVINTGGQDHRWMGNGVFKALGARIIASNDAVADQRSRADMQMTMLRALVGEDRVAGTEPTPATETFDDALDLTIGGVRLEIRHLGGAHTPGHSYVWLPDHGVLYTGDGVYVERLLGVLDHSDLLSWIAVFQAMADLNPAHVVPGHGSPTTIDRARADTLDYLVNLRDRVRAVIAQGGGEAQALEVDQSAFAHLANFDTLARRNAQQAFIQLEFE
ncbi:MAG: MBL fold metallo-hydrolase [Rhodobacterales bacterium]|nr:MBL fold metallo-hydrolase [Rhodobacterales bacterium]